MDIEAVEKLLQLMRTYDVHDLSYEDADFKVRLRTGAPEPVALAPAQRASPVVVQAQTAEPAAEPTGHQIKSPIVGTFYRSPGPDKPAFVEVGARVKPGTPLCIVEAMKLMNEIESDVEGVVTEICATNGSVVQYGQVLFVIQQR